MNKTKITTAMVGLTAIVSFVAGQTLDSVTDGYSTEKYTQGINMILTYEKIDDNTVRVISNWQSIAEIKIVELIESTEKEEVVTIESINEILKGADSVGVSSATVLLGELEKLTQ